MNLRKKNVWVRFSAILLAVCLAMTTFGFTYVSAEPVSDADASSVSSVSETEDQTEDGEQVETAEQESTAADSTVSESQTEEEQASDGSDVVNFVVIDQSNVSLPGSQMIAISAGENEEDISDARLTYGLVGGDAIEVTASQTKGDTALFKISCDENTATGVYRLQKFTCKIGEKEFVSDFAAQDLTYEYGVEDDSASTEADVYIVDADQEESLDLASDDGEDVSDQVAEDSYGIVTALDNASEAVGDSDELDLASGGDLVICLDPGHDSVHAGATGNGLKEEVLTLKIANYLKEELSKYPNVTVYMTRTSGDCPVSGASNSSCLEYRPQYAKNVNADVFISLHINAADSTSAHGALVCVPNMNYRSDLATISQDLAQDILDKLVALGMYDRGFDIRYGDSTYPDGSTTDYLSVIRNSKKLGIPGILIEHGFISGTADQQYLNNEAGLKSMAVADAQGIAEYYGLEESNYYAPVFDAAYYWENHPDIQSVYKKTDTAALLNHFILWGMTAGWQGNEAFNVQYYMEQHPELIDVYGTSDLKGYYLHYIRWGKAAGWAGSEADQTGTDTGTDTSTDTGTDTEQDTDTGSQSAKVTTYEGFDYSAVYDPEYYWNTNKALLQGSYKSTDYDALLYHFVAWGMDAGLQASEDFNVYAYKNRYADLRSVYGDNIKAYYLHYCRWGKEAGLNGKDDGSTADTDTSTDTGTDTSKLTVYGDIDYSPVYDPDYYWTKNKEVLQGSYKSTDYEALLYHFVAWGMDAGLQASEDFNVQTYMNRYSDLRAVYGSTLRGYYMHYIWWGKEAGLSGSGEAEATPITTLNGQDYSLVYDYDYYLENYPEVEDAVGTNDVDVLNYFVEYGMAAGQQACADFNVYSYRAAYPELRSVYGANLKGYYMHYIWWGKEAGLNGNSDATWAAVTELDGQDYSDVYDYDYYLTNNPQVATYVGYDETAVLQHFVNTGMNQGLQASAEFNVQTYMNNNPDLAVTYGSNWKGYYLHYIWWGKAAGLNGSTLVDSDTSYPIMGSPATTAAQMARYFKSKATYPSFYSTSDAPTINDFCQIVYEEAVAEGVKPEVVMAQAMHETGLLKFGGDVDISQYNFAGIGATGNGVKGNSFPDVRTGIRAQVQHLKAYASTEALNNAVVDPRFSYVTRGCATTLAQLSMKWAMDTSYGKSLASYVKAILAA